MKRRLLLISVSVVAIVATIWIIDYIHFGIHWEKKIRKQNKYYTQRREKSFYDHPNLLDCLVLLDRYYWWSQENDKALYYGEYCTKLGVDKTRRGCYVHMVLADIYAKKKDMEKACYNINVALMEAERDKISESEIKQLGMQSLIDSCKKKQTEKRN